MKTIPYYFEYYEQEGIRKNNVALEDRTPVTIAMIPPKIDSLLDIGCGDGTLLSLLPDAIQKTGIDISRTVLQTMKQNPGACASADALPFHDSEFDCVMSTEMLEHLPHELFSKALTEIARVARTFILISVPFQEDLASKQCKCSNCNTMYHIHYHLRSFNLSLFDNLFTQFIPTKFQFSGPSEPSVAHWVLFLRRKIANRWEWDRCALCPQCGSKQHNPPRRTIMSVATSLAAKLFCTRHPKWISVLYTRKN